MRCDGVIATVRSCLLLVTAVRVSGCHVCCLLLPLLVLPRQKCTGCCVNVHRVALYKSEAKKCEVCEKFEEELWQRIPNPVRRLQSSLGEE